MVTRWPPSSNVSLISVFRIVNGLLRFRIVKARLKDTPITMTRKNIRANGMASTVAAPRIETQQGIGDIELRVESGAYCLKRCPAVEAEKGCNEN